LPDRRKDSMVRRYRTAGRAASAKGAGRRMPDVSAPRLNADECQDYQGPAGEREELQGMVSGGGPPDADEQPRSGERGESRRARRLRRPGKSGPELGLFRCDRHGAAQSRERRNPPRPVGKTGRRLPDARGCPPGPHRQLAPRAAVGDVGAFLGARIEGAHDVRPDDGRLLDVHRDAGYSPGDVRDLRRVRAEALRRGPLGTFHPLGGPRRDGRRAAARDHDERRRVPHRRGRSEPHPAKNRDAILRRDGAVPRRGAREDPAGRHEQASLLGGPLRERRGRLPRARPPRRDTRPIRPRRTIP
jgi:hypothetical protein